MFGNPSKKDSLILVLPDVRNSIATDAAAPLLRGMLSGRVYVKWPYLQEAEVRGVCYFCFVIFLAGKILAGRNLFTGRRLVVRDCRMLCLYTLPGIVW